MSSILTLVVVEVVVVVVAGQRVWKNRGSIRVNR